MIIKGENIINHGAPLAEKVTTGALTIEGHVINVPCPIAATDAIIDRALRDQVVDTIDWTLRQHSIDGFVDVLQRPEAVVRLAEWPQGLESTVCAFVEELALGFVPFHPRNPGLHMLYHRSEHIEAKIRAISGYREEA